MPMRPKVLILSLGGMISGKQTVSGVLDPVPMTKPRLMKVLPELKKIAAIDLIELANMDSAYMTPSEWIQIGDTIRSHYEEYSGFVILQGQDTMAYTAAALSFMMQYLSKPIVLTGSLLPLEFVSSDAKRNIIDSVLVAATADLAEVCVVHNGCIIRGTRIKKLREMDFAVFESVHIPPLGTVKTAPELTEPHLKREDRNLIYRARFETQICVLLLYPGFRPEHMEYAIELRPKALVLLGYSSGSIPVGGISSIYSTIKKSVHAQIPVFISSQSAYGECWLSGQNAGVRAKQAGAYSTHDMTYEAAIVKSMWILTQTAERGRIKEMLETNYAGEISAHILRDADDIFGASLAK